jgi:ketosteroid isomerase-like protein
MKSSSAVKDAWERFCDRLSAGDVDAFDEVVAPDAKLIIGTAPGEWVDDRARMRFGFEAEGVTLTPDAPEGYEEGTMGWLVDQPTFGFPDGSAMKCRFTTVFRRDAGAWKLVHMHASVGVPDEEVVALQKQWGTGA